MPEIGPIRMFEGADFDCGTGQPFIELNSASTALGPVWIIWHRSALPVRARRYA